MSEVAAVGKLLDLTVALIERVKDGKTAALVQQIQTFQQMVIAANAKLLTENAQVKAENLELKAKILKLEKELTAPEQGYPCPFCQRPTALLVKLEDDETLGPVGVKRGFYKCSRCGKEFDKQLKHGF